LSREGVPKRYSYKRTKEEWQGRRSKIAATPDLETSKMAIESLENQLDRMSGALDSLETKAGAVIAGVLTVATVLFANTAWNLAKNAFTLIGGGAAIGFALLALALSVATLWPEPHGNGPDPALVGPDLGAAHTTAIRRLFESMDLAVTSTTRLVKWKSWTVRMSMVAAFAAFFGVVLVSVAGGTSP
jgi:hypothetical protein